MGKFLNAAESFSTAKFRLQFDAPDQFLYQTALSGQTKLGREIRMHMSDDLHACLFHDFFSPLVYSTFSCPRYFFKRSSPSITQAQIKK